MVNGATKPQSKKPGLRHVGARGPLPADIALTAQPRSLPRPANLEQSLRRIRTELALILTTIDDGLQRIESERQPSQTGDFQNGAASGTV